MSSNPDPDIQLIVSCMVVLSALACGGDGSGVTSPPPPPSAHELQIASGNGQSVISGSAAAAPLRVRVIGSDTRPLSNVTVDWFVADGLGVVSPVRSTTNASGEADTHVTIGSVSGLVHVTARVPELAPVSFALTAVEACRGTAGTISFDVSVAGTLGQPDCRFHRGQFHDFYRFALAEQQAVLMSVRSVDFDPDVDLFTFDDQRDRGIRVDTVDATREAKLKAILAPGRYEVAASSAEVGVTGPYTLRLSQTSPSAETCETVYIVRGVTTAQRIGPTDCVDDSGVFYGDAFVLWLTAGEQVEFTHSSAEFGPLVMLYRQSGTLVDQKGGGGTGTASLGFTADLTGYYFVIPTSDQMLGSGAYTLSVSEPAAAAASASTLLQVLSESSAGKAPHFQRRGVERLEPAWEH